MGYDLKAVQESYYKERIGKVYGMFEVIAVQYDEIRRKQKWTLKCINCGCVKETYNGQDYVKGKNNGTCKCSKVKKEKKQKINYYDEHFYGNVYDVWKVITGQSGKGWLCECVECGRQSWKSAKQVYEKQASKCIHRHNFDGEHWIGKKYGNLTIIEPYDRSMNKFLCKCDCGNTKYIRGTELVNGISTTCGSKDCVCHKAMLSKGSINGFSHSGLYGVLNGMKNRCYNANDDHYYLYGGRGIKICNEWLDDFFNFFDWAYSNGYEEGLTIDRIDVNGNYEPSNCRWITMSEQAKNKRPSSEWKEQGKRYTINGVEKTQKEWCKEYGISTQTIRYRIKQKGMSFEEALKTHVLPNGRPRKK